MFLLGVIIPSIQPSETYTRNKEECQLARISLIGACSCMRHVILLSNRPPPPPQKKKKKKLFNIYIETQALNLESKQMMLRFPNYIPNYININNSNKINILPHIPQ